MEWNCKRKEPNYQKWSEKERGKKTDRFTFLAVLCFFHPPLYSLNPPSSFKRKKRRKGKIRNSKRGFVLLSSSFRGKIIHFSLDDFKVVEFNANAIFIVSLSFFTPSVDPILSVPFPASYSV